MLMEDCAPADVASILDVIFPTSECICGQNDQSVHHLDICKKGPPCWMDRFNDTMKRKSELCCSTFCTHSGLGGISLGRGSQGTSSLPLGSEEFLGIPKVPPSS